MDYGWKLAEPADAASLKAVRARQVCEIEEMWIGREAD
jgi:hypothetical protein